MSMAGTGAVTIVVGSTLFLMAAFSPISRIFGIPDSTRKLQTIMAAPRQWRFAQLLFAMGAVVTAVGIGFLAAQTAGATPAAYLYASTILMGIGALSWGRHVYMRAVRPDAFTAGEISAWLFAGYSVLTLLGLALLGGALLQLDLQPWIGWVTIGSALVLGVLGLLFRDMPPFVYYVITLAIGIALLRA